MGAYPIISTPLSKLFTSPRSYPYPQFDHGDCVQGAVHFDDRNLRRTKTISSFNIVCHHTNSAVSIITKNFLLCVPMPSCFRALATRWLPEIVCNSEYVACCTGFAASTIAVCNVFIAKIVMNYCTVWIVYNIPQIVTPRQQCSRGRGTANPFRCSG